jgi:hypothetical protein
LGPREGKNVGRDGRERKGWDLDGREKGNMIRWCNVGVMFNSQNSNVAWHGMASKGGSVVRLPTWIVFSTNYAIKTYLKVKYFFFFWTHFAPPRQQRRWFEFDPSQWLWLGCLLFWLHVATMSNQVCMKNNDISLEVAHPGPVRQVVSETMWNTRTKMRYIWF